MNCKYLTRVLASQCLQHVPSPAQERQNKCCRTKAPLLLSAPWGCLALKGTHLFHSGSCRGWFQCHTDEPGGTRCCCWCTLHQIWAKASGTATLHKEYHALLQPGKLTNLLHVARLTSPIDVSWRQKWEWNHWQAITCYFSKEFNTHRSW